MLTQRVQEVWWYGVGDQVDPEIPRSRDPEMEVVS